MDLSTATAISTYNYQSALKTGTQASAVLQALNQAYASQNTLLPGETSAADSLTQLAGSSALGSLVSGIYSISVANGGSSSPVQGLNEWGGLNASSVSALLGGGPSGFPSMNMAASEALAAYQYQLSVNGSGSSSAATDYAKQLALTAQSGSMTAPLNLLA